MSAHATTSVDGKLPPTLRLGPVRLTVTDIQRAVGFYESVIGLSVVSRSELGAALGAGGLPVVELVENRAARRPGRESGLYHYALLLPNRTELARAAVRIAESRTPIQGASDHHTHEAIYLPDPDGNGIELAADRPRDQWPAMMDGSWLTKGPEPLDVSDLLAQVEGEQPHEQAAEGVRIGHLHLHVADIERGLAFYRDVLGFELKALLDSAAFVSAGGYHHHLAFNVWRGKNIGAATEGVVGLRHWTIEIDEQSIAALNSRLKSEGIESERFGDGIVIRDPFGIAVAVAPPFTGR